MLPYNILLLQFFIFFVNSEILTDYKNALAENDAEKLAAILDDKFEIDVCGKKIVKKSEFLASIRSGMKLRKWTVADETATMIRVKFAGAAISEFDVTPTTILAERVIDCQHVIATTPLINENAEMARKVFAEFLTRKNFSIFADDYQQIRHCGEAEEVKTRQQSVAEWKYLVAEVADASTFRIHDERLMENDELHFTVDQLDEKMYVVSSTSFVVDMQRGKIRKEYQWLCGNAEMLNFAKKQIGNIDEVIVAEYRDALAHNNREKMRMLIRPDFKILEPMGSEFIVPIERRLAVFGARPGNLIQTNGSGILYEHMLWVNRTVYEIEVKLAIQDLMDQFVEIVNEKNEEKLEKIANFNLPNREKMEKMIVDELKIVDNTVTFLGKSECYENRYVVRWMNLELRILEETKIVEKC